MSSPGRKGGKDQRRDLSDEEIALLDSLTPPFIWGFQDEQDRTFFAWIDQLDDFVQKAGHFPPYGENKRLANALAKHMSRMRAGTMEPERRARLEQVPGFAERYEKYLKNSRAK